MVALLSIGLGVLVALAGFYQLMKPRLPKYTFGVRQLYPKFLKDSTLAYQMGANIKLHNDNFVAIHIFALSFDLFYPDWEEKLHHVGRVTDKRQQTESADQDFLSAIWVLPPRHDFETVDDVIMIPNGGARVMSSLSWDLLQKKGKLQVPLSGVIHVKADGKIPITLSMICDNLLDAWKMEVKGVACTMDSLQPGWSDLEKATEYLRNKMEGAIWQPADHPQGTDADFDEICASDSEMCFENGYIKAIDHRIEWEDALPVLNL
mmetsp:Transcript_23389/g.38094  ORF Transcript_23389/g.38094 Transcript_23389/m.38094 type:complete len:263 (-) Transcript_23389:230-1018(-)